MHEALDLNSTVRTDMTYFRDREFARQNNAREAKFLERLNPCKIMHRHLRARMNRQLRYNLLCQTYCSKIL